MFSKMAAVLHDISQHGMRKWLDIEVVQQYDGIGLASAVLYDVQGPFGCSEQILTIRPLL